MQNHRKAQQTKKSPPVLLRSPAFSDDMPQDIDLKEKGATSDESSGGGLHRKQTTGQMSPRKIKKVNNLRRKSLSRSPTSNRGRRRSNDDKPSSLPSTLPRRRSAQKDADDTLSIHSSKSRLSPHR